MGKLLSLLAGLLAVSYSVASTIHPKRQIVEYITDPSFESVSKKALNKPEAVSGGWRVDGDAVFVANSGQPSGQTTPYGSKYVYFHVPATVQGTAAVAQVGAVRQMHIDFGKADNITLFYSYAVFAPSSSTCQLASSFQSQQLDSFPLPTSTSDWVTRTKNFAPAATSGSLKFALICAGSPSEATQIGLDQVSLEYAGCPACGTN